MMRQPTCSANSHGTLRSNPALKPRSNLTRMIRSTSLSKRTREAKLYRRVRPTASHRTRFDLASLVRWPLITVIPRFSASAIPPTSHGPAASKKSSSRRCRHSTTREVSTRSPRIRSALARHDSCMSLPALRARRRRSDRPDAPFGPTEANLPRRHGRTHCSTAAREFALGSGEGMLDSSRNEDHQPRKARNSFQTHTRTIKQSSLIRHRDCSFQNAQFRATPVSERSPQTC